MLPLVLALSFPHQGACNLIIDEVYTCDAAGNRANMRLGDDAYGLEVEYRIVGTPAGPFRIRFRLADREVITKPLSQGAGHWRYYTRVKMPLDGPFPVSVELDPDKVAGDDDRRTATFESTLTPAPPTKTLEYYSPLRWRATLNRSVSVSDPSAIREAYLVFAKPRSDTFQSVRDVQPPERFAEGALGGDHSLWSVSFGSGTGRCEAGYSFSTTAQAARLNVRGVTARWADLDGLPPEIAAYTKPTVHLQAGSPALKGFVASALPTDYRTKMRPIESARALFRAVMKRLVYKVPCQVDAEEVLARGTGDCGGMSGLYVAALRTVGIPARVVCGFIEGKDKFHCWSEMYLPGTGWIPQDVTYGNGNSEDGAYAYYFAVMPDLNRRVVTSWDTDVTLYGHQYWTLQTGESWLNWVRQPRIDSDSGCSLVPEP